MQRYDPNVHANQQHVQQQQEQQQRQSAFKAVDDVNARNNRVSGSNSNSAQSSQQQQQQQQPVAVTSSQQQQQQQQRNTGTSVTSTSATNNNNTNNSTLTPAQIAMGECGKIYGLPGMRRAFARLMKGGTTPMSNDHFFLALTKCEAHLRPALVALWARVDGDARAFISQLQCTTENALIQGAHRTHFGYELSLQMIVKNIAPMLLRHIETAEAKELELSKLIVSVASSASTSSTTDSANNQQQHHHFDPVTGVTSSTSTTTTSQKLSFLNHQVDEYILSLAEYFCDALILAGNETLWNMTVKVAECVPDAMLVENYVEYLNKKAANSNSSVYSRNNSSASPNMKKNNNGSLNSLANSCSSMLGRSTTTTNNNNSIKSPGTNSNSTMMATTNTVGGGVCSNSLMNETEFASLDEDSCPALSQQSTANNTKLLSQQQQTQASQKSQQQQQPQCSQVGSDDASTVFPSQATNTQNEDLSVSSDEQQQQQDSVFPIQAYLGDASNNILNLAWFNINHYRRILRRELSSVSSVSSMNRFNKDFMNRTIDTTATPDADAATTTTTTTEDESTSLFHGHHLGRQWLKAALESVASIELPSYCPANVPFTGGTESFTPEMLVLEHRVPNIDYFQPIHVHSRTNNTSNNNNSSSVASLTQTTTQHPALNPTMRIVLVDWLHAICTRLRMSDQTFHLNIALLDIALTLQSGVTTHHLQLLGIAAMFIASKYHEIAPPEVQKFVYMSANAYSADEIISAERNLFAILDCKFAIPSALDAADLVLSEQDPPATPEQKIVTEFLLHVNLHHQVYGGGGQSMLAARAAVFISKVVCDIPFISSQIAKSPSAQRNSSKSLNRSVHHSCSEVPPKTASSSPVAPDQQGNPPPATSASSQQAATTQQQQPVTSNGNPQQSEQRPSKKQISNEPLEGWKHISQNVFPQSTAASEILGEVDHESGQLIYSFKGRKGNATTSCLLLQGRRNSWVGNNNNDGDFSSENTATTTTTNGYSTIVDEENCEHTQLTHPSHHHASNRNRCRDDDEIQATHSNQEGDLSTGNNSNMSASNNNNNSITTGRGRNQNNNNNSRTTTTTNSSGSNSNSGVPTAMTSSGDNSNEGVPSSTNRNFDTFKSGYNHKFLQGSNSNSNNGTSKKSSSTTTTTNFNNFFNTDDLPYCHLKRCHLSQNEFKYVEKLLDQLDVLRNPETKAQDLINRYSHRRFGGVGTMVFDRERIMSVARENLGVGELFATAKY